MSLPGPYKNETELQTMTVNDNLSKARELGVQFKEAMFSGSKEKAEELAKKIDLLSEGENNYESKSIIISYRTQGYSALNRAIQNEAQLYEKAVNETKTDEITEHARAIDRFEPVFNWYRKRYLPLCDVLPSYGDEFPAPVTRRNDI